MSKPTGLNPATIECLHVMGLAVIAWVRHPTWAFLVRCGGRRTEFRGGDGCHGAREPTMRRPIPCHFVSWFQMSWQAFHFPSLSFFQMQTYFPVFFTIFPSEPLYDSS